MEARETQNSTAVSHLEDGRGACRRMHNAVELPGFNRPRRGVALFGHHGFVNTLVEQEPLGPKRIPRDQYGACCRWNRSFCPRLHLSHLLRSELLAASLFLQIQACTIAGGFLPRPAKSPPPPVRLRCTSGYHREAVPCPLRRPRPFATRKSFMAEAISTTCVSSAKCPVLRNWILAPGISFRNASAPAGMKKGSFLPQIASNGGFDLRKYS